MPDPVLDAATGIEEFVASRLERCSALHAIVKGNVFPGFIPELEGLPAVVYQTVGTQRSGHMQGADGLTTVRMKLQCLALSGKKGYALSIQMAKAIRLELDGYKGSDREKGFYIRNITIEDEADDPLGMESESGSTQMVHNRTLAVKIVWREQTRNNSGGS